MSNFKVTMQVTGHPSVAIPPFIVDTDGEDAAIDEAFERAFREFPQFGSFQCVEVEDQP